MIVIIDLNMIIKDKSLISKLFPRKIMYVSYQKSNKFKVLFKYDSLFLFMYGYCELISVLKAIS